MKVMGANHRPGFSNSQQILPSNVESLQHHLYKFLKQTTMIIYRSAYCVLMQDDIVSNDFAAKRSESECVVIKSGCVIIH